MLLPSHKLTCLLFAPTPQCQVISALQKKGVVYPKPFLATHLDFITCPYLRQDALLSNPCHHRYVPSTPAWLDSVQKKQRKPGISKFILRVNLLCIAMVTKVFKTTKKPKTSIQTQLPSLWKFHGILCTRRHVTNTISAVGKAILVLVKGEETLLMPDFGGSTRIKDRRKLDEQQDMAKTTGHQNPKFLQYSAL